MALLGTTNETYYEGSDGVFNTSDDLGVYGNCLLYTAPSPRDLSTSRMPSSA